MVPAETRYISVATSLAVVTVAFLEPSSQGQVTGHRSPQPLSCLSPQRPCQEAGHSFSGSSAQEHTHSRRRPGEL